MARQPKRLALLAFLAVDRPGGFHAREGVQALFWPEHDTDRARNALDQSVHWLRKHLGERAVVGRGRSEIGVDPAVVWCDAVAFERRLEEGRTEEAVELYGGELLPGVHVTGASEALERWLADERARLERAAAAAARELSRRCREVGDATGAAHWARRALRIEPEDEAALRRLLEVLGEAGDRAGAIKAYEAFVVRLADELGVAPDPETVALAEEIRGGRESRVTARRAVPPEPSVAVLPFLSLGSEGEAWFADGLAEELIASLAVSGGLKVASRTSSFAFRESTVSARTIGERLGVSSIVEGSVRWADGRVRITAQLIDAGDDSHLWADTYERAAENLFAIQADVANRIVEALSVALTDAERRRIRARRSASLSAYRTYLEGRKERARGTLEGVRRSIERFESAAAEDLRFALARAAIGEARLHQALFRFGAGLDRDALLTGARTAVDEALELDPDLPEANVTDAVLRWYDRDWDGSIRRLRRALALAPQSASAHHRLGLELAYLGRFDESRAALRRAHDLDPLSMEILADLAVPDIRERRFDAAIEWLEGVVELDPGFGPARVLLREAYRYGGRPEDLIDHFVAEGYLSPGEIEAARRAENAAELVAAYLPAVERHGASPTILAGLRMQTGDEDAAFSLLERAVEQRDPVLADGIRNHPGLDVFRGHPRFEWILEAMRVEPAEAS